jgi:ABC-type Mn2+/Zn2+ transport system ATPase subunit
MNPAIEISRATVSYREHVALKNISLIITAGSFVAIVGPNGAGKTTLLTLIVGLGKLQQGYVCLFNTKMVRRNIRSMRRKVGYVSQHFHVDPRTPMNVYDGIMLGRYGTVGLIRRPGQKDHNIVARVAERIGITHLLRKPIGHLSGGEEQKVSLARALVQDPEILLLDEPTANLDPRAQSEITDLIEELYNEKGFTVLFVTHVLNHLPCVCSHAVLMKDGHIKASGRLQEVFTSENLSFVYDYPVQPPVNLLSNTNV